MKTLINVMLAACLFAWGVAKSDQTNPELDELFQLLQTATDLEEARVLSDQIWFNWYQHDDDEVTRLMELGETSLRRGQLKEAVQIYSRVIELDQQYAEGWNRRATTYYMMGRYVESTADVVATLALEPRHFGALSGQGMIYMRLDNSEKAIEYMEKALEVNPHMVGVQETIEILKKQQQDETI